MNSKLKIALFLLVLFAGLFVLTLAEHQARFFRYLPLVGLFLIGYLIYAGVSLFRSANSLEDRPGSVEDRRGADSKDKTKRG